MITPHHRRRPRLATWDFASCGGCRQPLADCEDELRTGAGGAEIVHFSDARTAAPEGPYDVSVIQGSAAHPSDVALLRNIRSHSRFVVTVGACATTDGSAALRQVLGVAEFAHVVFAPPDYIRGLKGSGGAADHVKVDYALLGCPVDRYQLAEVVGAVLHGRVPTVLASSVCDECSLSGITCLSRSQQMPCLGAATQAGCGALCPSYGHGCFHCYGPTGSHNAAALVRSCVRAGATAAQIVKAFRTYYAAHPARGERKPGRSD